MKKLTAFTLALFMLFTGCPLTVSAQNAPREIEWQSRSGFFVGKSSSVPDDNCIQFDNASESISFSVSAGKCYTITAGTAAFHVSSSVRCCGIQSADGDPIKDFPSFDSRSNVVQKAKPYDKKYYFDFNVKSVASELYYRADFTGYVLVYLLDKADPYFANSGIRVYENDDEIFANMYKDFGYSATCSDYYRGGADDYHAFDKDTTYISFINRFDGLMNYSTKEYSMQKLAIGEYSKDDGTSGTLYGYTFSPENAGEKDLPIVMMIAAQHGGEKNISYGLYYFLSDLMKNASDSAAVRYLRSSVIFKVVPVCNPSGWDRMLAPGMTKDNSVLNDPIKRNNALGQNINREYNRNVSFEDWSCPEAKAVASFFLQNGDDGKTLCFFDLHTNGEWNNPTETTENIHWIELYKYDRNTELSSLMLECTKKHFNEISEHFAADYGAGAVFANGGTSGTLGKITNPAFDKKLAAYADAWAMSKGAFGATVEGSYNFLDETDEPFSPVSQKACSEMIGNYVRNVLNCLAHHKNGCSEFDVHVIGPTCISDGYEERTCRICSASFTADTTPKTGHTDSDNNGNCDICGAAICSCNCHKRGLLGFIWKIQRIFYRIFGKNAVCQCGIKHY